MQKFVNFNLKFKLKNINLLHKNPQHHMNRHLIRLNLLIKEIVIFRNKITNFRYADCLAYSPLSNKHLHIND